MLISGTRNNFYQGQVFGNVSIVEYAGYEEVPNKKFEGLMYNSKVHYWKVRCLICGNEKIMRETSIYANPKSCGCNKYIGFEQRRKDVSSGKIDVSGMNSPSYKHGMTDTKLYITWKSLKKRCSDPHDSHYHNYGGRGITVCPEWSDLEHGFENFAKWAFANGYTAEKHEKLSIDRKNVNKGYSPDNCIWAGSKFDNWHIQQGNNTTANHMVNWGGLDYTLTELAYHFGHDNPDRVTYRMGKGGKSLEEALLAPAWSSGRKGSKEREDYISIHGDFKRNPNAINPLVSTKYADLDLNEPKLRYYGYDQDAYADDHTLTPLPQETEEEYKAAREAAKQTLIRKIKDQGENK